MRVRVRGVGETRVCCTSLLMVLAKPREANERLPIIHARQCAFALPRSRCRHGVEASLAASGKTQAGRRGYDAAVPLGVGRYASYPSVPARAITTRPMTERADILSRHSTNVATSSAGIISSAAMRPRTHSDMSVST